MDDVPPLGGPLALRIATAPYLTLPVEAAVRVADWLGEIDAATADALHQSFAAHAPLAQLTQSLGETSPYLWDLVRADARRFLAITQADPDQRLAAILGDTARAVAAAEDDSAAMRMLRALKSEGALLIALADIGGVWPVMRTTRALTDLADTAVSAAVRYLFADAARRGRIVPPDISRPEENSGYIVLAMGKMGAGELNYSSDIDLIVFYDPDAAPLAPGVEPAAFAVRITRGLVKLLQERAPDYVFRTDLRLRPDPASTQIAVSTPTALNYYESVGQNWERAAMIKARPCAGDIAAGERLLDALTPFIWRKYLDFAAVADVHAMKRQIHAYRGHGEIAVEGHNVKLGRGGIREIEFFAQTQQLIAGGRHPELRSRETLATLSVLAAGSWISAEARDELTEAYHFLRTVEHRLQMIADEQTHTLPADAAELDRFVRFAGFPDRDAFAAALLGHLQKVQRHYATLFESAPAAEARARGLRFPAEADDRETLDKLSEMGFRHPLEASATVRHWLSGEYRSLRGEAVRDALGEIIPLLLDQFARSENPHAALNAFDQFLSGLHGAMRLMSLLRQNTDLIALLALVLGTAPRLADTLARYPQVMDAMIDPSFFGPMPEEVQLTATLDRTLGQSIAYEDFLDRIRIFAQEQHFLIGTRILSGTVTAEQAGEAFARLADVLIRSLFEAVMRNFIAQHGRLPGQHVAVVALGRLGGREMTATSDLDLIVIYDFEGEHPHSDGARPLAGAQYFARLTQRLIGALTAQTSYGALYPVDMRLRPSGRSGPLATSLAAFKSYQESEAWTWEQLALTRARIVAATPGFAPRIAAVIHRVLARERDSQFLAGDVADMRQAIAAEKGDANRWDLKYVAGGLVDIEFVAQYLQLAHAAQTQEILDPSTVHVLDKARRLGLLASEDADVLRPAVRLYHDLIQIQRLCLSVPFDPKTAGRRLIGLLTRAADVPDFAQLDALAADTQAAVRQAFLRILEG